MGILQQQQQQQKQFKIHFKRNTKFYRGVELFSMMIDDWGLRQRLFAHLFSMYSYFFFLLLLIFDLLDIFCWNFLNRLKEKQPNDKSSVCVCLKSKFYFNFKNRKMKIIDFLNILIFKQNITQHNALYVLSCKIKTLYIYIYRGEFMRRKIKQNIIIQWCDREGRSTKKNKFDILNYLFFKYIYICAY